MSILRADIAFFTALKSLRLDNNRLTDFSALGDLPQLRRLSLSDNRLPSLPTVAAGAHDTAQEAFFSLQSLDVSFNLLPVHSVFSQDSGWARLPGLQELDLSGNDLRKLPHALGAFPSLRSLALEYNGLSSDCLKPLSALPALQVLSLAHNRIKGIPDRVSNDRGCFRKLRQIDLSFNRIRHAPALLLTDWPGWSHEVTTVDLDLNCQLGYGLQCACCVSGCIFCDLQAQAATSLQDAASDATGV